MKDIQHHIQKLNRQVIRSMHRDQLEEELPDIPRRPDTKKQIKKKAKIKKRNEARSRPSSDLTPEQRNRIMKKGRVPIFDKLNAKPKHTRASKKKTPRI